MSVWHASSGSLVVRALSRWGAARALAVLVGGGTLVWAIAILGVAASVVILAGGGAQGASLCAGSPAAGAPQPAAVAPPARADSGSSEIPSRLLAIFAGAAARYGLGPDGWAWLASINKQETDFGRDLSVSSAGAFGWMQFMPDTWRQFGLDANGDGSADPNDPWDGIYAAAAYLRASGAPRDWHRAVFEYNHAEWYVRAVADRARRYGATLGTNSGAMSAVGCAAPPTTIPTPGGYALPLAPRYMSPLGRTDDGVDIENAPDGATVYSITPGICTAVGVNPPGFGPSYPVIRADRGAVAGQYIYYGHVVRSLVGAGQRVAAGQPIAIMGHTGDAVNIGHGHIEIGFSDAGGNPIDHHGHGADASTPSGRRMRALLIAVGAAAGLRLS